MTPRGTLESCCVHISQLMTHPAIYTIPFTLQLCYNPLGILQRLTKSQNVHISNHDGFEKLHNITFLWHWPQCFPEREQSSRNPPFLNHVFWEQQIYCSSNRSSGLYSLTTIYSSNKYLQGNLISHDRSNGRS